MRRAWIAALALLVSSLACAQDSGAKLFEQHCAVCHEKGGEGIPGFAPKLAGALGERLARPNGKSFFAHLLLSGMIGPIVSSGEKYNEMMPPFGSLTDAQIAALLDHVLGTLNQIPAGHAVTIQDIAQARGQPLSPSEVRRLRGQ